MDGSPGCDSYFEDVVTFGDAQVRVYRYDWGWYVKSARGEARSRFLDEALETVLGRLDQRGLRALVDTLGRELTAERNLTGRTASRALGRDLPLQ